MAFYQFRRTQNFTAPRTKVWDFISNPENLRKITPKDMGFIIVSEHLPKKMYPGMVIEYLVKPLWGIKTTWVTEITHVKEGYFFVDEQRVGPYALWHHQHILEETDNGTRMTDIISYQPPFGFLGRIANGWIIRKKLKGIFDYREKAILEFLDS